MAKNDDVDAAARLYVYGYPMVYNLGSTAQLLDGSSPLIPGAGVNRFGYARKLLGPEAEFVSPNNDTLYVVAGCDVSGGPLVLHVPDTHDRYYVLQFVDAWTNNFAYIGRRATGTDEATYLLAAGGYRGDVPAGTTVVEAPSDIFTIVGRVQVNGENDLPAVHALQDEFTLRPLDRSAPEARGLPAPHARVPDELAWWEQFRVYLAAFPPPPGDADFIAVADRFGLTGSGSPLVDAGTSLVRTLVEGKQRGEAMVEEVSKTAMRLDDGWSSALHSFDYNLDRFGIGTIDRPEWKIADRTVAYVTRAAAARGGLWGNHGYEARYDALWQDEHGDELDGSRTYELTLSPPPPVDAFWSLTMYDEPEYYLVANPIDRYSIGDRTPGLEYGDDGSVTIYLQRESPGADKESNWLPAPPGKFRPLLRAYQPQEPLLSGGYKLPAVRRTS
jgi:hypothetical protein